jgi:hypothetical protein
MSVESIQARKLLRHIRARKPALYDAALKKVLDEPEPTNLLPTIQALLDIIKDPLRPQPQKVTAVGVLMSLRR